ncbi:MAG: potassium/proton antiporter [Rikenellaceae bacterium]|nr:potassium/proton antiporter [Rikenellaceae bacterium]
MALFLLIFAVIIFTCIFFNKFSGKVGIPVLLFFLMLGFLCGSRNDDFAENWGWVVGNISTIALVFIMFYGGFGTRWKSARPIAVEAGLLATVGVALTACFVGLFCHFVLGWAWLESFLMGAVISSTDAATVFSILRTRKLGLKNNSAPILEVESGSNDPMSYMLTAVMLSLFSGGITAGGIVWQVFAQIVFGAAGGLSIAAAAVFLLRRINFQRNGFDLLLFIATALAAYSLPELFGGNGYLSAYIVGIVLGNTDFPERKSLVSFFDAITSLMQIVIFFLLGMLAIPSNLFHALLPALAIFIFLTLAARPLAVCGVLAPFRKYPFKQLELISFVGLRGAASIVFAINILTSGVEMQNDIFSIVFCIVLLSIAFQGSLIPAVAKATGMTDSGEDVMTTFSDFSENAEMSFGAIRIMESSSWNNRQIKDLDLPQDCIIALVVRGDLRIVPKGSTLLETGDEIVLCTRSFQDCSTDSLIQHPLSDNSKWAGHKVCEYPQKDGSLLVMIQRGEEKIIPNGDTILEAGDVIVLLKRENAADC